MALAALRTAKSHQRRNLAFTIPTGAGVNAAQLFQMLNGGPNLRAITNAGHNDNLPGNWKLSFGRVAPKALLGDANWFTGLTVQTFDEFEQACARLLQTQQGGVVRNLIGSGVVTSAQAKSAYLGATSPFSVRRLDIVVSQNGPIVCENDDMPGGLVHAYWLDRAYGVNQGRWQQAMRWLTRDGSLVFAVSSNWGAPYTAEITWFAQHLRSLGYDANIVTGYEAQKLRVTTNGVTLNGKKAGTVWRQFPIFEAHEAFAPIVAAAQSGKVRLAPELASWGNKAWMGVFWQYQHYFQNTLSPRAYQLLSNLLPYTRTVQGSNGYPTAIRIGGRLVEVKTPDDLKALPTRMRKQLVLKTCGAHNRAARSHGVVIGTAASGTKWKSLLDDLARLGAPIAVQEYRPPTRVDMPVWSVLGGQPRLENPFTGKMLIRPWAIGGRLVSATAFLTEPDTSKLHGTTTGAEIPLKFD